MSNVRKGQPDCRYCEGTGVRYAPNGPEDFDKEVCECTDQPIGVDELLEHLSGVTGLNL